MGKTIVLSAGEMGELRHSLRERNICNDVWSLPASPSLNFEVLVLCLIQISNTGGVRGAVAPTGQLLSYIWSYFTRGSSESVPSSWLMAPGTFVFHTFSLPKFLWEGDVLPLTSQVGWYPSIVLHPQHPLPSSTCKQQASWPGLSRISALESLFWP